MVASITFETSDLVLSKPSPPLYQLQYTFFPVVVARLTQPDIQSLSVLLWTQQSSVYLVNRISQHPQLVQWINLLKNLELTFIWNVLLDFPILILGNTKQQKSCMFEIKTGVEGIKRGSREYIWFGWTINTGPH